jgi:hypothetical protein
MDALYGPSRRSINYQSGLFLLKLKRPLSELVGDEKKAGSPGLIVDCQSSLRTQNQQIAA